MGRDANGTFTRTHNWVTDKNNSLKITASRFDAENDDFASGLSASGETAKIVNGAYNHLGVVETTAENSISATPTVAITSYTTGQPNWWIPGFNNTGSVTLTISGLSAASVQCAGAALTSGMLLSGVPAMTVSDGSGFHLMNPMRSPADWMNTAGMQNNSVTLAKWNHESTQGALITMGASGTPQYLTASTSGYPLVTKGASVDAAFQQLGENGIGDNELTLAKLKHETVQGAIMYLGASGTPTYLAPGSSGEVLQSGGASANVSWVAAGTPSDNSITLAKMAHDVQGTLIYMDASGTPTYLAAGTSGQYLQTAGASANPAWATVSTTKNRNDVINGGYLINQENNTAATDDSYSIGDLFNYVGENAATTSLQTSSGPQGDRKFARINHDNANAQAGWVYFMTNDDVQDYIMDGKISFGFQAKTVSAKEISNLRAGILKWNSTADIITSDVVGTWASDGTDPTLATNWSYENTPSDLALTTSWQRFTIEDVTVDDDTNNIALFVWTDDGTITANDQWDITEWTVNPGSTVNDFSSPLKHDVAHQVDYFLMRYDYDSGSDEELGAAGVNTTTSTGHVGMQLRRALRVTPAVTSSASSTFRITNVYSQASNADDSISFNTPAKYSVQVVATSTTTPFTQADPARITRNATNTTYIQFDARL